VGPSIRPVTAPRLPVKVAALALGASLLGACAGSPAGTATPTATPAPTFPIPIREGQAPAGVYTTTLFKPTVLFTIPSDGWRFFFTVDDDELAVGKGNAELTGGRVANVLEPTTHATIPAPDTSWPGWLLTRSSRPNRRSR